MHPLRLFLRAAFLLSVFFGRLASAHAHDPGLSAAVLTREGNSIEVLLSFAAADAQSLGLHLSAEDEVVKGLWSITSGGEDYPPHKVAVKAGEKDDVVALLRWEDLPGAELMAKSTALERLPRGHRQVLTGKSDVQTTSLLSAENLTFAVPISSIASGSPVGSFFLLGLEHIFTGYDHLLFLLALLLVCPTFRSAAVVISCFTLAHSITLALAALDVVRLPSSLVELVIAASIVYVAATNLFRQKGPRHPLLLTSLFGLVHGLGFATALQDAGVGAQGSPVVALLFFNLGVEAGQLAIAAVILPLLLKLRQRPAYQARWVPAVSALICLAGGWWVVERAVL